MKKLVSCRAQMDESEAREIMPLYIWLWIMRASRIFMMGKDRLCVHIFDNLDIALCGKLDNQ